VHRRKVLEILGRLARAGLVLLAGYPVLRFAAYRKPAVRTVRWAASELRDHDYRDGVYLIRNGDGWRAVSAACSHLGCRVRYDPAAGRFACPCHRSEYDAQGRRLRGPARCDLAELAVTRLENQDLVVEVEV
jgi:cytochrome b6-f complex iron-sulfur subunit